MATSDPWWIWFLPILFSAPWIVAIIWFWPWGARSGEEGPLSMAELARQRLWLR
jgi:hypothetical protein